MKYAPIADLAHIADKQVELIGGKAANLAKLVQANITVPDGFVVGVDAFDENSKLSSINKKEISGRLDKAKLYAVRSSALSEDSQDASWAGQFETFLYTKPDKVIAKVEECRISAKERAKVYADESGLSKDFSIATVVQEMIDPEYAGVLFTKNPVSGKNEFVVEYVSGIGEQLVSGKTTPKSVIWNPKKDKITSRELVPFNIKELFEVGQNIVKLFDGIPQDIEWAVDKDSKLWITQSRPITTLDIKHVGEGHHYLGDPGSLFYWGPANARTLYMSDFLSAIRDQYDMWRESSVFPDPPKTLLLFHEDKALWLNKKADWAEFTEQLFASYSIHGNLEADRTAWEAAKAKIDPAKTYEPKQLLELLKSSWAYTFSAEFALYGAEGVINKQLNSLTDIERHKIWGAYSLPSQPSFINKIDKDVIKLKNPLELARKYSWALSSYAGVAKEKSLIKYFTQRIKDLEGNSDVLLGSEKQRNEIAKEFKLSSTLRTQLDLARTIAEFMDDRKAWMMQSRYVIQRMVQAYTKSQKLDLLTTECCRLDDLSAKNPAPYFGWTYINGRHMDLSKTDVERSWEWYVEYKAATTVLKGIVSSRGGRHFMTGEVVVVHDPAEQVAPGKIVVVPSTGPSYVPIMRSAAALVTDHGGMMSHAAIVAREFNLPCIVGTVHATKILKNGDKVVLDLVKGEVNK